MTKWKAVAKDKMKVDMTKLWKSDSGRVESIVEKGENTDYQHFVLFPQCFQSLFFQSCLMSAMCCKGLTLYHRIPTFNDSQGEAF